MTTLAQNLARFLTPGSRTKGDIYFRQGKVRILFFSAARVEASVLGQERYQVTLVRDRRLLRAGCTCPYFTNEDELCKHIWATVLASDRDGALVETNGSVPPMIVGDPTLSWSRAYGGVQRDGDFAHDDAVEVVEDDETEDVEDDEVYDDEDEGVEDEEEDDDVLDDEPSNIAQFPRSRFNPSPPVRRGPAVRKPAAPIPKWKAILRSMDRAHPPDVVVPEACAPQAKLRYVIDGSSYGADSMFKLAVTFIRPRAANDGTWTKPKAVKIRPEHVALLPDPSDRTVLSLLSIGRMPTYSYYYSQEIDLTTTAIPLGTAAEILPTLCSTGRLFVSLDDGREVGPFRWDDGPPWELRVHTTAQQNAYVLEGKLHREGEVVPFSAISMVRPGFLFMNGAIARLQGADVMRWVSVLGRSEPVSIPREDAAEFVEQLISNEGSLRLLELPEELRWEEEHPTPEPRLVLRFGRDPDEPIHAQYTFLYEGNFPPDDEEKPLLLDRAAKRFTMRDLAGEHRYLEQLRQLGFRNSDGWGRTMTLSRNRVPAAVRSLVHDGWRVEAEGKRISHATGFRSEVTSGIDWFELHGGAMFGDQMVSMPALLAAARRGETLIPLGDGGFGLLPEEWLARYEDIASMGTSTMGGEGEDHVRFTRAQAGFLDALLAAQPEVSCDEVFAAAREKLQRFDGIAPQKAPAGFVGTLRPYQEEGLGWFSFLQEFGFGGCLADDMGLGKTVQVLALLEQRRASRNGGERRPSLVVAPKSLIFNWKDEAARFTPNLTLLDHTGTTRRGGGEHFGDYDVVLTTYGTLRREAPMLAKIPFDYVILDEAQAIKNAATQSSKSVRLLQASHRLALSGTPIENHLGELWSLFEFLNPGVLGASASVRAMGSTERMISEEGRQLLARALRPYILRRTKDEVAKELPSRTEQTIHCEMEAKQRKIYDELRLYYQRSLQQRIHDVGLGKAKIHVLEALLRLRQAACHPGLVDPKRRGEASAKLDTLLPRIREIVEGGHKVLVFSQFTSFLSIVRERLDAEGIAYCYLDGKTRDRAAVVEQFQNDPATSVFLISLKAGGLGLNLTAAEYVFLLDPWWNPAVEAQAIDRAHRIGQTRHVVAYRLVCKDTVEEKILELQATKRELADSILGGEGTTLRNLEAADIEMLFS